MNYPIKFSDVFGDCNSYSICYVDNVPMFKYAKYGLKANPSAIALAALHGNRYALKWLVDNAEHITGMAIWRYDFDWFAMGYRCKSPWPSAMANGLAISALVQEYEKSYDRKYLQLARKACLGMEFFCSHHQHGNIWFDEYVGEPSANVLNGFLFALLGLQSLARHDSSAAELYETGLHTLSFHSRKFELNWLTFKWSRYDDNHIIYSGDKYHNVHIKQLRELGFYGWAARWESYKKQKIRKVLFEQFYRLYCKVGRQLWIPKDEPYISKGDWED